MTTTAPPATSQPGLLDLDQLQRILAGLPEGPWWLEGDGCFVVGPTVRSDPSTGEPMQNRDLLVETSPQLSSFIVAVYDALPDLLAELQAFRSRTFPCCKHCAEHLDDAVHDGGGRDQHEVPCDLCEDDRRGAPYRRRLEALQAERDALLTLMRRLQGIRNRALITDTNPLDALDAVINEWLEAGYPLTNPKGAPAS